MAKVFMVRVCETVANLERKISNRTTLIPNGIKQAERVRDRLSSFPIRSIYSSALDSAFKTAEIVTQPFRISVSKCPELNEMDLGEWDGMKKTDIAFKYEKEWKEWLNNPTKNWKFPGAKERLIDVQNRAIEKLNEIVVSHREDDVLCVITHGIIIRAILCFLLEINSSNILKFHVFNGSVSAFDYDGNRKKTKIHFINDICHLQGLKFAESITGKPWMKDK